MKPRLGKLRSLGPRKENISGLVKGRKRLGKIRSLRVHNIACSSQGKS